MGLSKYIRHEDPNFIGAKPQTGMGKYTSILARELSTFYRVCFKCRDINHIDPQLN